MKGNLLAIDAQAREHTYIVPDGPKPPPTDEPSNAADSFLLEIARAPARAPPGATTDPVRVGQFRIERRLGVGGMGVVYRAMDEKLKRSVALKVLPTEFEADPERRRRFLREARSAAAITHPNIATIYDVGEADGHVFIAMELVEGQSLRARILDEPSVAESLRIATDIARGLKRAHQKGVVHRDLKPENIMISFQDEVKILDFGLAKVLEGDPAHSSTLLTGDTEENLTLEGRVVGTPAYMSPEQTTGGVVDARADIFSFGVVLYEMLAGTRPFKGATSIAVMLSAGRDTPKPASEVNPESPAEIDRVIARCLEKEPAARYANGTELLAALAEVQSGVTGSLAGSTTASAAARRGPGASSGGRAPLTRRRSRRLWILGAVLAAVPVLALGARLMFAGRVASPGTTATSSASAPSATGSVIGLLDHPPPVTKSAEAGAAYRRALIDLRDGVRPLRASLERAVQLDPEFAAAHLRLSIAKFPPASTSEYAETARFKANLDPRDQQLFHAEEPIGAGVPQDLGEGEKRYAELYRAYPGDVEILMRLAAIRGRRDPASARETFAKLIALAPTMPAAQLVAGDNAEEADDLDAASEHYQRCLTLSPVATRCLSRLARLQASGEGCDSYARDMTRILVLEPDDWYFRRDGLSAALATGAAPDEVRAAIEGVLRTDPGSQKRFDEEQLRGEVALWHGSMLEARDAFLRADLLAQDEGASRALPVTAGERLNVAEELGDEDEIRKITRGYVGARALTTPENNADGAMLTALRRHRILPDSDVLRIRDRWRADAKVYPAPLVWLDYEAGFATTEAEARDALASGVDAKISHGRLDVNAKLGRVLLLARRFADAVSRLERVAFSCAVFRDEESYVPLIAPAAYELGRAREGMGDPAGACDAYRRVLDLWSNATPRSTTAEAARSRFRDLRCKD